MIKKKEVLGEDLKINNASMNYQITENKIKLTLKDEEILKDAENAYKEHEYFDVKEIDSFIVDVDKILKDNKKKETKIKTKFII